MVSQKQREHLDKARKSRTGKKHKPSQARPINSNEAYTLGQLEDWFGIGVWSFRKMERNGLTVTKIGSRKYVLGSDLLKFMADKSSAKKPRAKKQTA